jgi:hypothetical protein
VLWDELKGWAVCLAWTIAVVEVLAIVARLVDVRPM